MKFKKCIFVIIHIRYTMTSSSTIQVKFEKSDINDQVVGTLIPPTDGPKKSVNIIISYDRSGSMNAAANTNGDEITKYYSKNDLAKHSISIVANSLGADDTLEIITYDSLIETVLPRTAMNADGKKKAMASVSKIEPRGCTELWKGLKAAMDAANKTSKELGDATVVMITDGEPSNSPANGEVQSLKDYRIEMKNTCRLHTIGIGYDIKSKLLVDLTNDGQYGGSFIFIPDGSMMITSWVNLLANEKNIIGKNITVQSMNGKTNYLGTIKYGQNKTFLCDFSDFSNISSIKYESMDNGIVDIPVTKSIIYNNESVVSEIVRTNILKAMNDMLKYATINITKCQEILRDSVSQAYEIISDHPIIEDMTGEIATGFESQQSINRWGLHYIRSLTTAHTNRDCLNFKDPGPKMYESVEIKKTREIIDKIANTIEIPQPSLKITATAAAAYSPPVSQNQFWESYNNAQGGCFGGYGTVMLQNETLANIKDLKKGDVLENGAKIECVIVFHDCDTIIIDYNLEITPWHPIYMNNEWIFPNKCKIRRTLKNRLVYNFILDSKHMININGIDCCTLGHGFTGPVIQHEFYGTQRVIDDFKKFNTYTLGIIDMTKSNVLYDFSGNEIIGYKNDII